MKLESELQDIRKTAVMCNPPLSRMILSSGRSEEHSPNGCHRTPFVFPRDGTPSSRRSKTPGSIVSQLISKFEYSSRSTSPACSEPLERLGSVDYNSNLSKSLDTGRSGRGSINSYTDNDDERSFPSYEGSRSSRSSEAGRTSPVSNTSTDSLKNLSPLILKKIDELQTRNGKLSPESEFSIKSTNKSSLATSENEQCYSVDNFVSAKDSQNKPSPTSQKCDSDVLSDKWTSGSTRNLYQDKDTTIVCDTETDYNMKCSKQEQNECEGVVLAFGLDFKDENNEQNSTIGQDIVEKTEEEIQDKDNAIVEVDVETEFCMETSHLMKLMNEVAEQRELISELKQQVM